MNDIGVACDGVQGVANPRMNHIESLGDVMHIITSSRGEKRCATDSRSDRLLNTASFKNTGRYRRNRELSPWA